MQTKPTMSKQETINFLNGLAEHFENKLMTANEFRAHCMSAIALASFLDVIDYIERNHLSYQAMDISKGEYTRFEDPDLLMPLQQYNHPFADENQCGHDLAQELNVDLQ